MGRAIIPILSECFTTFQKPCYLDNSGAFLFEMEKPTVIEIEAYFEQIGVIGQSEMFFNHYESNGWMIGKNKMKNWQAACRNWKIRMNQYSQPKQAKSTISETLRRYS